MPTISKEDYLKTIYHYQYETGKNAPTTYLSNKLDVSKAAVTDMIKKLAEKELLNYQPYKGVSLTKRGEIIAKNIIRRHRLWELFLMKTLNLTWDEVHAQAEELEHSTTEFLIEKIDKYLGKPKIDPHGDPIPNKHGQMPDLPSQILLCDAQVENKYFIARINDQDSQFVKYLSGMGIKIGSKIKIIEKYDDNSALVILKKQEQLLRTNSTNKIYVSLKKIGKK